MAEILSQEEIDALLSAYSSGTPSNTSRGPERASREVALYDFSQPERFSKEQLRQIDAVNNSFASTFATQVSVQVRSSVDVQHTTMDQASFDDYLKSIPSPTLISTFRMEPLGVRCIVEFNPNVVFTLVDLMAGGDGDALLHTRGMTDIELRLMEGIVRLALSEYASAWEPFSRIECELERVGSNQMVSPIARPKDRMLGAYFEVRAGNQVGLLSFCLPILAPETILDEFASRSAVGTGVPNLEVRHAIAANLVNTSVWANAELGHADVTLDDLLNLQEGDVIRLDQPANREIVLAVQGVPKFLGIPGCLGRNLGVHITRELTGSDDMPMPDKEAA